MMLTFPRALLLVLGALVLTTGCGRKQLERERQTAQLVTISKRLDEIQANLAVMSETRTQTVYAPAPAAPAAPVTLVPENDASVVQITDFSKAEPLSRREQISRLGQRTPTAASKRPAPRRNVKKYAARRGYGKTIAVSGLSAVDLQKALKNAGFNPGKVDGKIGPNTVNAVKQFQAAEGLQADGVVGRRTWEKLSAHLNGAAAPAAAAPAEPAPVVDPNAFITY